MSRESHHFSHTYISVYDRFFFSDRQMKKRTIDRKHMKDFNHAVVGSESHARNGATNGKMQVSDKGEFDDLISALRTGDVFGEDSMAKIKRSRRARHSPPKFDRDDSRERILNRP